MAESTQIIIGILSLVIVVILAMLGTGWWTKRMCLAIMRELESRGAFSVASAVALPYDKVDYFRIGYRDYRPKALEMLLVSEAIYRTPDGRYYLNKDKAEDARREEIK